MIPGLWGWVAGGVFVLSVTIGNLYRLAPDGDYLTAVHIFAVSVALLTAIYGVLLALRRPGLWGGAFAACALLALWWTAENIGTVQDYSLDLKWSITGLKAATAVAVAGIFLSFPPSHLFERLTWAGLLGLEGYSFFQYPLCKIFPGGSLDPSLWFAWGDQLDKSACSRAFGPALAYADVVICAIIMIGAALRWHYARSDKASG